MEKCIQDLVEITQKFQTNTEDTNLYRPISPTEISTLIASGNSSTNWSLIFIPTNSPSFSFEKIRNCRFEGQILLLGFTSSTTITLVGKGIPLSSGLFNSTFSGFCIIGKDCHVQNNHCIHDTSIGDEAVVIGCGIISSYRPLHSSKPLYGMNTDISVGPSTGGRTLHLHPLELYSNLARKSLDSHFVIEPSIGLQLWNELLASLTATTTMTMTMIGSYAQIIQCDEIMNCLIGPYSQISQTRNISDCTFYSSQSHPVVVKRASELNRVIMLHNSTAGDECRVRNVQMFEYSSISGGALVEECVLAPDASVGGGECCHSIVGPHIGFHHSCLLISSIWPFGRGNLSYGCKVGANHTGRVSDQENHPGEGCFFGLGVQIKFPSNSLSAPYTLFASGITCLPQILTFPFSLISSPEVCGCQLQVSPAYNSLKPGWVLYGNPYMLIRATQKPTQRRKAKLHDTAFPVMRQSIVEMMMRAREDLRSLLSSTLASAHESATPPPPQSAALPLSHSLSSSPSPQSPAQQIIFTEKDCFGIGKNVVTRNDALCGYHAYDDFIKAFVLEKGFFEYLRSRRQIDQQRGHPTTFPSVIQEIKVYLENKTSLPHPPHHSTSSSSSSTPHSHWAHAIQASLLSDLHLFDPISTQTTDHLVHVGTTMVSKETAWALSHLLVEFPHAFTSPLHPLCKSTIHEPNERIPAPSSDLLHSYLVYLMALLEKQLEAAKKCRQSDAKRGVKIIPDYDQVHPSLESDEVIGTYLNEVERVRVELSTLLAEVTMS